MASPARVLIVNSNDDVVEMLRLKFVQAGWHAVTAHVTDAKRGRIDLVQLVEHHDPSVIVYDVAPPYDENWRFLGDMRSKEALAARPFVVTTTNRRQLEKIAAGAGGAIEIVGKPYDLDEVLQRAAALVERGAPTRL
jgi:DNA-binding response OmpR family regulator